MTRLDRALQAIGVIALIAILLVILFGTTRDSNQDVATRRVGCAVAEWNGKIVAYFDGSAARLKQRIGTSEELSTDRAGLIQLESLLDASVVLAEDLGPSCGRIIPLPKETP